MSMRNIREIIMKTKTATKTDVAVIEKSVAATVASLQTKAVTVGKIRNEEQYQQASNLLNLCAAKHKEIEADFEPVVRPMYDALQALYSLRKKYMDPIGHPKTGLIAQIKAAMQTFKREEMQKQIEAEAQARRIEEEAEAARERAELVTSKASKTRLLAKAEEKEEEARDVAGSVADTRAVGSSAVRVVKWELKNFEAIILAVAEGEIDSDILCINEDWVSGLVKHDRAEAEKIKGIRVYEDVEIRRRG